MAFLTLAEAALLVGVNKATLWRAIKQGRLSAHREDNKSYRIEESELLRVFPAAGKHHSSNDDSVALSVNATLHVDALRAQIELMHRQIDDMQRDKQWLMQRIETLEATQRALLPAPKRSWVDRLAESWGKLRRS